MACCTDCNCHDLEVTNCDKKVYGFIWKDDLSWCTAEAIGSLNKPLDLDDAFIVKRNTSFGDIEDLLGREYAKEFISFIFG